ncbi:MAG: ExbD/TolR family protein [Burkholderiaceae bacterium]|jgi:biopolymer transport protein ExbD
MNFRRNRDSAEPDINLIPMIDVLLVVLIFLMVSTTYVKRSALKVDLPQGRATSSESKARVILIRISAQGQYALDERNALTEKQFKQALTERAGQASKGEDAPIVRIEADEAATHQMVVVAMDAAAAEGLTRLSIVTAHR